MIDLDELIAEARSDAALRRTFFKDERDIRPYQEGGANQTHAIMDRLADALEAATRERDAATEARIERWMQLVGKGVEERMTAEAERDAALARIAEAAKLHRRRDDLEYRGGVGPVCDGCGDEDGWASKWPCPTAVALGLNEGENE